MFSGSSRGILAERCFVKCWLQETGSSIRRLIGKWRKVYSNSFLLIHLMHIYRDRILNANLLPNFVKGNQLSLQSESAGLVKRKLFRLQAKPNGRLNDIFSNAIVQELVCFPKSAKHGRIRCYPWVHKIPLSFTFN